MRREKPDDSNKPDDMDDATWWATLEDDALEDETRSHRRRERWLPLFAVLALLATCVVIFLHTETLFS